MWKNICFLFLITLFFTACLSDVSYTPKPRGFPKVIYPNRDYQKFAQGYCPFEFELPSYAKVEQDTVFFNQKTEHDCWFDIAMPAFNGRIHCTYKPIDQINTYQRLKEDVFKLAGKHNVKANYIDEMPVVKPNGVKGFVFDIEGAVASPFIFYLSDEVDHFMTGSLYFETQARPDSMAPVYNFVKEDMMHMINTFEWSKK